MKYASQYFQSAIGIVNRYTGDVPLASYLKTYFAANKKFGSKDRKWITHLCYTYYRIGHALKEHAVEDRMRVAVFLCHDSGEEWGSVVEAPWLTDWHPDLQQRIGYIRSMYPDLLIEDIFPWGDELSAGIDREAFILSHLVQPDLFLRIRPGKENFVQKKLSAAKIDFRQLTDDCLALPNASKVDAVLETDKDIVIQDLSSQRVGAFLQPLVNPSNTISVYDCCAASGGKSIMVKDLLKDIDLTVSDVRPSILRNLKDRFERAGIKGYHSFVSDLANSKPAIRNCKLVIADVPCSGSGTWSRTPEQLYFFTKEKIGEYATLQSRIVQNVTDSVAKDGYLLYITCSVFAKENEAIVEMIQKEMKGQLVKTQILTGYDQKADSMFAALFKKD